MRRDAPGAMNVWLTAVDSLSALVATMKAEWIGALDKPERKRSQGTLSAGSSSAFLSGSESSTFTIATVSEAMTSASINGALDKLGLVHSEAIAGMGAAYSRAIRTSLGSRDPAGHQGVLEMPRNPSALPRPADVERASGLSLPLLEFQNIILSRNTAVEFLKLSQSGLGARYLLDAVFRPEIYRARFDRPEIKIKRRQVFTYAEALSLIEYAGPVNLRL
jgi:hypothetical protein